MKDIDFTADFLIIHLLYTIIVSISSVLNDKKINTYSLHEIYLENIIIAKINKESIYQNSQNKELDLRLLSVVKIIMSQFFKK